MAMRSIDYSDGKSGQANVLRQLKKAKDRHSLTSIASDQYDRDWILRYHLCPERANLLRHLDFSQMRVLEVGAGMGAVSRYLAESAGELVALEGTYERARAIKTRLQDLDNWEVVVGNVQDYQPSVLFDVVCVVGVLEYAELFVTPSAPGKNAFDCFLELVKRFLKPDGVLVLAIENRLGMKYWAGASEDHTGYLYDGICGYQSKKGPRTFSRSELLQLFKSNGFAFTEEYYPFPDYKTPRVVLSRALVERAPGLVEELAAEVAEETHSHSGQTLFSPRLALKRLALGGLFEAFSNSFLFLGASEPGSETLNRLQSARFKEKELGWYYALSRRQPIRSLFYESEVPKAILKVRKERLSRSDPEKNSELRWHACDEPVQERESLRTELSRALYFGDSDQFYERWFSFLRKSLAHWQLSEKTLQGRALDAVFTNATPKVQSEVAIENSDFHYFDLEWEWTSPIPKHWYVFRNVFLLHREFSHLSRLKEKNLKALYHRSCRELHVRPHFSQDVQLESRLQSLVSTNGNTKHHAKQLIQLFTKSFSPSIWGRDRLRNRGGMEEFTRLMDSLLALTRKLFQ